MVTQFVTSRCPPGYTDRGASSCTSRGPSHAPAATTPARHRNPSRASTAALTAVLVSRSANRFAETGRGGRERFTGHAHASWRDWTGTDPTGTGTRNPSRPPRPSGPLPAWPDRSGVSSCLPPCSPGTGTQRCTSRPSRTSSPAAPVNLLVPVPAGATHDWDGIVGPGVPVPPHPPPTRTTPAG